MGIGTATPTFRTEIISTVGAASNDVLRLSTLNLNSHVDLVGSGTNTGNFRIRSNGGGNGIIFQTSGNNDRMIIDANGNVGIGTTSPLNPLEVTGTNTVSIIVLFSQSERNGIGYPGK